MATRNEPDGSTTAGGPVRWSRLASLGLLMGGLAPLLMLVAGFAWGLELGGDDIFLVVTTILGALGAFLVLRFGTWSKALGIVVALALAGALFWTAFGLVQPSSFFDFVPGLLLVPGVVLALVGCIGAIVAGRRGRAGPVEGGERTTIRVVVAAVSVLAVVSAGLTLLARESVDGSSASLTVAMKDFEYDRAEYALDGGSTVLVRNDDPFAHTFTIDELGIDEYLTPAAETLVELPPRPGDYVLYCTLHTRDAKNPGEDDMASRVSVE